MSTKLSICKEFSERLKKVRETLSYTQDRMAQVFDMTRAHYVKYESGYTYPPYGFMLRIADRCTISLDWLILGKGEMLYRDKQKNQEKQKEEQKSITTPGEPKVDKYELLSKEHRELLENMQRLELLHYDVMAFYHRFKLNNKELFQENTPQ